MFSGFINTVDTHTAGQPTRVVLSGFPPIRADSMLQVKERLASEHDSLRKMLMHEPRGHRDMFGAVLFPPVDPAGDLGVVFMDTGGYLNMCGHGCMGVAAAAWRLGLAPGTGDDRLRLDTPAGLVETAAAGSDRDGSLAITVRNVPAFALPGEHRVPASALESGTAWAVGVGAGESIPLHIAFGGSFFAAVALESLPEGDRAATGDLISLALEIRRHLNESCPVEHPANPGIRGVDLVEFYGLKKGRQGLSSRNLVVFGDGQVDRSPCGTGTSAEMALLHERGLMGAGDRLTQVGPSGLPFTGRIAAITEVEGLPAVIPEITGQAFITGFGQMVADRYDPLAEGFLLDEMPHWEG